jgi:TonB family protein
MPKQLAIFAGFMLATSGLSGQKPSSPDQFRQYLLNSAVLSQLEVDRTTPFHLKASLKWLSTNNAGNTADSGTIEVLWKDPHHYRITVVLASRKLVENDDGENPWRTDRWALPEPVVLAQNALLNPYYRANLSTDRVSEGAQIEGQLVMDCIDTAPDIPGVRPDAKIASTTYCLTKGNHLLRLIRRPNNWKIAFNDIKAFENKYFARSIEIARAGRPVLWLRVDSIEKAEDFSILNEAAPKGAQMLHFHIADGSYLSAEVMRGTPIYTTPPLLYSDLGHSGVVVVKLHIDLTGTVSSAEIVNSPNEFLSAAAISQVKQWRYSLSYINNKVVPIDDVVTIQFNK